MAFDGCGVTDGFCGTICAKGLRRQCKMVRRQAQKKVKSPLMIQYSKLALGFCTVSKYVYSYVDHACIFFIMFT